MVSNAAGSATSEGARLTVSVPVTITQQPQAQTVAVGSPVTFHAAATGGGQLTYQWRHHGGKHFRHVAGDLFRLRGERENRQPG